MSNTRTGTCGMTNKHFELRVVKYTLEKSIIFTKASFLKSIILQKHHFTKASFYKSIIFTKNNTL